MTLTNVEIGEPVKVIKLPNRISSRQHLNALSIEVGSILTVIRKSVLKGPIIVKVGLTEIAIGRGLSEKVEVEPT